MNDAAQRRQLLRDVAQRAANVIEVRRVSLLDPHDLLAAVQQREASQPDWFVSPSKRRRPGWRIARCALLYDVCGCSTDEVARILGIAVNTVRNHWRVSRNRFAVVDETRLANSADPRLVRLLGQSPTLYHGLATAFDLATRTVSGSRLWFDRTGWDP